MISEEKYVKLVEEELGIHINDNLNQKEAILSSLDENQYIVAGPGSGKTTVLVLKILKYILVDGLSFKNIMVTTFTKKAANEIKERVINWYSLLAERLNFSKRLNLDGFLIGTLDSIAEELVSEYTDVEIIDNFTSSAIMMQNLLTDGRNDDKKLKQFTKNLKNNFGGASTSDINNLIQTIKERIYYDMLDKDELRKNADREKILYDIIDDYTNQLKLRKVMDYAMLENKFHELLLTNTIERLAAISVILIDEYQDTNLLQEKIYFKIAEYALFNNGNITVVGDDDQSLYRFRGASIELFTDYVSRISDNLEISPKTIFLQKNYRSSQEIIDFANEFITLDEKYQESRASDKPLMISSNGNEKGLPVFGMFRNNLEELSTDLSILLYDLKMGNDYKITRENIDYDISTKKINASIAILTNSPKEINASNKKRLPFYIRESLSYKDDNIVVFNPRGQSIETTEIVSLMCGLILLTIDPESKTEENLDNLPPHTKKSLETWRNYAQDYLETQNKVLLSVEDNNINLSKLLEEIEIECSDLMSESNENIIFHDILIEAITQTDKAINDDGLLTVNQIFWHILVPIASGAIEIDDDMFDVNLEENINIMSIHQSKGLEFDVVIVDVGSDIFNNYKNSAFKRFPQNGGLTYNLEKYLKISDDNTSGLNKAFDELIRRYFVAYTRAKSILILVGLNSMRYGYKGDFQNKIEIENIATGWSRDKIWHWDSLNNLIHI